MQAETRGRHRLLTPEKKAQLCDLVRQSASIEQAAESVEVSLRTVQRERLVDDAFDRELRQADQTSPDPKRLMELAARTHWRAAAWLLERTDPETYARKPVNSASPKKVSTALRYLQEAALAAVPAEFHEALYQQTQVALAAVFDHCFPLLGQWDAPQPKKLPFETPLADRQSTRAHSEAPSAAAVAILSPKTAVATKRAFAPPKRSATKKLTSDERRIAAKRRATALKRAQRPAPPSDFDSPNRGPARPLVSRESGPTSRLSPAPTAASAIRKDSLRDLGQ